MSIEPLELHATSEDAGKRLDQFLVAKIPDISRARAQQLIEQKKVLVNDKASKAASKLHGGEIILVTGPAQVEPLRAVAENIPLDIVFEDKDVAVVNKPAGMMVHAGAGATEDDRNRGTLVNALLHRFGGLSEVGGELRPGIVHRLDRNTSGLIVIAKNDAAHRKLAAQFSSREVSKVYVALAHGFFKQKKGTVNAPISRDFVRRTRMTVKGSGGRTAVSHYTVMREIDSRFGKFSLVEVKIETGRTHQIRVHLSSLGHPIVGDTLYGAPEEIRGPKGIEPLCLKRQFLHAAKLEFRQPRTGKVMRFEAELPGELTEFLTKIEAE
ncbi:MAG TPA: RluA family pseudouridine synthase [Terriglobales bacterium]|nr:RluA family pseudouridine synthase [Terriglobales bacterium]